MMEWPHDADGDALRRMARHGFDFQQPWAIDFNVDFAEWPPSPDALSILARAFEHVTLVQPDEAGGGYVQFQLFDRVSYALVMRIQSEVSESMAPFGGICESWGVLH